MRQSKEGLDDMIDTLLVNNRFVVLTKSGAGYRGSVK